MAHHLRPELHKGGGPSAQHQTQYASVTNERGAIMRRVLWFSILRAALTVATSVSAQDKLTLNQTYRDVIRLNYNSGSTQIPLPPGEWVLAGYDEPYNNIDIKMVKAYLARIENKVVTGVIKFTLPTDLSDGGWIVPRFCDRENIVFIEKLSAYESGDIDCWGINHSGIGAGKGKSVRSRMFFDYVVAHEIEVPRYMIYVAYYKADSTNYLSLRYYFNPDVEGVEPDPTAGWGYSEWHRNRINADPKKVAYIERLKLWGREWKRNVDMGFAGRLDQTKIVQPSVSPSTPLDIAPAAGGETTPTTRGDDTEARLRKLKGLFDQGLITKSEYAEKRIDLLKGLERRALGAPHRAFFRRRPVRAPSFHPPAGGAGWRSVAPAGLLD